MLRYHIKDGSSFTYGTARKARCFTSSLERWASQQRPDVWLSGLKLSGFRNYTDGSLSLERAPVVLIGPNGAGKTNLLEAVSLLAPGRGLRRAGRDELGYKSHQFAEAAVAEIGEWAISATLNLPSETDMLSVSAGQETQPNDDYVVTHKIGTGMHADETRRLVRLNGQNAAQSDLGRLFALILADTSNGWFVHRQSVSTQAVY